MTIYIVESHWRHRNYEWAHVELCSKQKVWNIYKYVSYFRFLKVATLCFIDSAANPWPSLNELHDVVTWNGFHFTGVPCQGSFVEFLAFLMGLGPSVVLCRSQVGTQLTAPFDKPIHMTTSWSSSRECQECSKQRVAILKNLKYKTCFELFHTFFVYSIIPYLFFHSFDAFRDKLQCK